MWLYNPLIFRKLRGFELRGRIKNKHGGDDDDETYGVRYITIDCSTYGTWLFYELWKLTLDRGVAYNFVQE